MHATFTIYHSSEFRKQALVDTGDPGPEKRLMQVDARDLRPDHRKRYLTDQIHEQHAQVSLAYAGDSWTGKESWYYDGPLDDPNAVLDLHARTVEEMRAKRTAENRERERIKAEREREETERREEKARKEAAGLASLRSWGLDHGSELLRARITDGFDFVPLAGKEHARAILSGLTIPTEEVPADFVDGYRDYHVKDRTTPYLDEIRNLRTIRESIKREGLADKVEAELRWVIYDDIDGNDEDDMKRPEIRVTVTDPTGNDHTFWFLAS